MTFENKFANVQDRIFIVAAALTLIVLPCPAAAQQSAPVQRGVTLAQTNCARCHSVDKLSPSPLTIAPAFRDLHKRYPVENLAESLAEGIVTGHPTMPEYRFDADQISDFIAFLKSFEQLLTECGEMVRRSHSPPHS